MQPLLSVVVPRADHPQIADPVEMSVATEQAPRAAEGNAQQQCRGHAEEISKQSGSPDGDDCLERELCAKRNNPNAKKPGLGKMNAGKRDQRLAACDPGRQIAERCQ